MDPGVPYQQVFQRGGGTNTRLWKMMSDAMIWEVWSAMGAQGKVGLHNLQAQEGPPGLSDGSAETQQLIMSKGIG